MAGQKRAGDFGSESLGPSCKKTPTRQVTKATFDKWQRDNDRDHQTLAWLCCKLERNNVLVAFLFAMYINATRTALVPCETSR